MYAHITLSKIDFSTYLLN
uniref:Uncharacterized protein n=1 Tax=Arundo donax TaxID=35708 RepID=A0A0A8Y0Q9_ARUDO